MSDIAESLGRLMRAQSALDKAKASCEYDQSYFLHYEIEAVKDAERAFIEAIKAEIGVSHP